MVENKPGGDAIVAITAFTGANDDHTLLMAPTSTFTAHPFLHEKLPYDVKELVPIVRVSNTVIAIGVPASLGINSMDELLKRAKAEPGKLNMASATGANDFVTVGFLKQANVDIARVPYRDTVQAINDLAEGRIQLYVAAYAIMRPQVQAGKVKMLALMNNERAPMLPDVPTARQAGTPGLSMDGLVGLFGSKEHAEGSARPDCRRCDCCGAATRSCPPGSARPVRSCGRAARTSSPRRSSCRPRSYPMPRPRPASSGCCRTDACVESVAILRDASLRDAPQDEGLGIFCCAPRPNLILWSEAEG